MHTQQLTLSLASSLTAERLMTLGGGVGESSRYNMLAGIQAFSIPRARWKTICIFIHGGCVRSHKQQWKLHSAHSSSHVCTLSVHCFALPALLSVFMQIFLSQTMSLRQNTCTDLESYLSYLSKCLSINASDLLALAPLTLTETARARKQKWFQLYAHSWLLTSSALYLETRLCVVSYFFFFFFFKSVIQVVQKGRNNSKHTAFLSSIYSACFHFSIPCCLCGSACREELKWITPEVKVICYSINKCRYSTLFCVPLSSLCYCPFFLSIIVFSMIILPASVPSRAWKTIK